MNKFTRSGVLSFLTFILIGLVFSSCVTTKQLKYFQDLPDSTRLHNIKLTNYVTPTIAPEDVLSITIATIDEKATAAINAAGAGSSASGTATTAGGDQSGFIVDSLGYILMPILGKMKVSGYTLTEITDIVTVRASKFFQDPIVVVKNKSFKITVFGEVGKPGVIYVANNKINILDLITLAGDLTAFAKRNEVMLLRRNKDNTISSIRLDLTKSDILRSPNFYLQNNDVIYVEPNSTKAISSDAIFTRNLTLITVALSVLTTILYLFK